MAKQIILVCGDIPEQVCQQFVTQLGKSAATLVQITDKKTLDIHRVFLDFHPTYVENLPEPLKKFYKKHFEGESGVVKDPIVAVVDYMRYAWKVNPTQVVGVLIAEAVWDREDEYLPFELRFREIFPVTTCPEIHVYRSEQIEAV